MAGVVIEIRSIYGYIHDMCAGYRIPEQPPDIVIETTNEDIVLEYDVQECEWDGDIIETFVVHRKLATCMLDYNVLLFHGSAVAVDGMVYIFTAKSGTGKSTHTSLWRRKFGDRAVMVNDDKPMLKVDKGGVFVCGTPWSGKEHLDTNVELPLKAICTIHQAEDNHIEGVSVQNALPVLLEQSFRPDSVMDMKKMLGILGDIAEHIPIYEMGCNMNPEAADVAWEGMKGA
jgi:hypothetical protein